MKKIISILLLFSLLSCSSFNESHRHDIKQVRYKQTSIRNIDKKTIYLNDGSVWSSNRFLIAVNLSNVLLVIEEYANSGYLYVDNTKVYVRAINAVEISYNLGNLNVIKNIDKQNNIITLIDSSMWYVQNPKEDVLVNWGPFPEIVISQDENYFLNTELNEFLNVALIERKKTKSE